MGKNPLAPFFVLLLNFTNYGIIQGMAEKRKGVENLRPCRDTETAKARGKLGGIRSGEAKREKKRMSQIYADFLASKHKIILDDIEKELEGTALLAEVMKKVLTRGDSASVSLLKELREATEGGKLGVKLEGLPQVSVLLDLPEDEGSDDENKE